MKADWVRWIIKAVGVYLGLVEKGQNKRAEKLLSKISDTKKKAYDRIAKYDQEVQDFRKYVEEQKKKTEELKEAKVQQVSSDLSSSTEETRKAAEMKKALDQLI